MSVMNEDFIRDFELLTLKRQYDSTVDCPRFSKKRKIKFHSQDSVSVTSKDLIRAVELLTLKRQHDSTVFSNQRSLKRRRKIESTHSLPHDTICGILAKLPVRSILRFRSVCRSWNQTINDPYFIRLQLHEARRKPPRALALQTKRSFQPQKKFGLYALEEETLLPELMFEREFPGEDLMIMSIYHCDGLILLYSHANIYLCNPNTREILALPKFSPCKSDPEESLHSVGFGLDRSTNKYKVVRMFYRHYSELTLEYSVGCEVFTPGMDSWRQIGDPPCPPLQHYSASTSTSGMVYWMNRHCFYDHSILSFNLSNEEFGTIQLPEDALVVYPEEEILLFMIVGYRERLWLVRQYWHPSTAIHIWELEDGMRGSWTKIRAFRWKFSDAEHISLPVFPISGRRRYMVTGSRKTVDCYDIESKETKVILPVPRKDEAGIEEDLKFNICLCIESLVPLCASAAGDLALY